jgi:4'-phosphopantetheinyl transferase
MQTDWAIPSPHLALGAHALRLWRADLRLAPALDALLSADERERAERFVFEQDRVRFVSARATLRHILARYLAVDAAALRFSYGPHGKPELAFPICDLRFNLAHSGELALYAFTRQRRVGIDVEHVRADLKIANLLSGVFTSDEQQQLATLPDEQRRLAFFTGWARKEAYLKARGDGFSYAPDRFAVSVLPSETAHLRLPLDVQETWSLYALDAGPAYAAAAVVEGAPLALEYYDATTLWYT